MNTPVRLQLADSDPNGNPFPFTVFSRIGFFGSNYFMEEAWATEQQALRCAKARQDQGYIVKVTKDIAYSVGE